MAVENSETEGQDWRAAYYEAFTNALESLKQERAAQVKRRIYIGVRAYVVKDMRDQEIEMVARREAEQACERAINEMRKRAA